MKIDKIGPSAGKTRTVSKKNETAGSGFLNLMQDRKDAETRDELNKMLKKIKDKGEELVESKNIELLVEYKKSVKDFVTGAVNFAFEVVDRKGRSRIGRAKILKIVSQIDDELVKITEEFLSEERNKLNLLRKIGELGGLLTNIYV
ncbi:MAG: YaaR family protein [Bacillota bacterium]|nr:YaaR family protein [Bacillota bacterium]